MRVLPDSLPFRLTAIVCTALLIPVDPAAFGQGAPAQEAPLAAEALDSLVAPIALYPDPIVAQVLAAATYPLEIVDANRWLKMNSGLQGEALVKAAAQQDWEPCVQALVLFPSVVDQMDANLKWTTALGNAFLAQQADVMLAIQRQRERAYAAGNLQSNAQQNVQVEQVQGSKVIVIQPANPEVIYVPAYNPVVVFGAAPAYYPYPAFMYPPSPTGAVVAAGAISFGVGIAVGAALGGWHGGAWGWGCAWGPRPALYVNNTFINRYGFRAPAYVGRSGTGAWTHNPYYRGAVPYSNPAVAKRYGSGRVVATPYGGGAGFRTPNGAAGAVTGPNRGAAGVTTPRGNVGAVNGPNEAAARVRTPSGTPGGTANPRGGANRSAMPGGSGRSVPPGTLTNPKPSAFGGGGANRAQQNSSRGNSSMGGNRAGGGRKR